LSYRVVIGVYIFWASVTITAHISCYAGLKIERRPKMQEFIIKEDFPKNQLEFDARFLDKQWIF